MAPRTELGILRAHGIVSKFGKKIDRTKITQAAQEELDRLQSRVAATVKTPSISALADTRLKADTGALPGKKTKSKLVVEATAPAPKGAAPAPTKTAAKLAPSTLKKTKTPKSVAKHGLDADPVGVAPVATTAPSALVPTEKLAPVDPAGAVKQKVARKRANKDGVTTLQDGNHQQAQTAYNKLECITPVVLKTKEVSGTRVSNLQAIGVSTTHTAVDTEPVKKTAAPRRRKFEEMLQRAEVGAKIIKRVKKGTMSTAEATAGLTAHP